MLSEKDLNFRIEKKRKHQSRLGLLESSFIIMTLMSKEINVYEWNKVINNPTLGKWHMFYIIEDRYNH